MAFRIIDASAFYAGLPFGSPEKFHTTPQVFAEIEHIKKSHGALDALIRTGRLNIREPDVKFVKKIKDAAAKSGDADLSTGDVSVLALSLELRGEIITDDYAVSNVAQNLGIRVRTLMSAGIKNVGRWEYYCAGCGAGFAGVTECPRCGNPLRRRLR